MGGLEALLASGVGQANLMGQVGTGLLSGSMGGSSDEDELTKLLKALGVT
jgi:hypothetical protein